MAIAKVLLLLLTITAVTCQFVQPKYKSDKYTPIIIGHRQESEGYKVKYGSKQAESNDELVRLATDDVDYKGNSNDNRQYTVQAHFEVTQPASYASVSKDTSSDEFGPNQSSYSYSNIHLESKKKTDEPQTRSFKSKFPKKPLFKPASLDNKKEIIVHDPLDSYELPTGIDQDPRNFKPNFKLQDVPNLYPFEKTYGNAASKGQVQRYLEDRQKILDEAVDLQLLNDPNPAIKGKQQQFSKPKYGDAVQEEYEESLKKAPAFSFDQTYPEFHRVNNFVKRPIKKTATKGLGGYRNPEAAQTYHFSIQY